MYLQEGYVIENTYKKYPMTSVATKLLCIGVTKGAMPKNGTVVGVLEIESIFATICVLKKVSYYVER